MDGKRYTDIFTGDTYSYHGIERMYRNLKSIPVLAKEGTILPLDRNDTANGADNPRELELLIFSGDGAYTLYEDDGESMQYQNGGFTTRRFTVKETAEQLLFTIEPAGGAVELVPEQREFRLTFRNVCAGADFTVSGTDSYSVVTKADCLTIDCSAVSSEQNITVCIQNPRWFVPRSRREKRTALLSAIPGNNILKTLPPYKALCGKSSCNGRSKPTNKRKKPPCCLAEKQTARRFFISIASHVILPQDFTSLENP